MTPERYKEIGRLYRAALEVEPERRAAFLAGACGGDEILRQEVESLLDYAMRSGGLIDQPALDVAAKAMAEAQPLSPIGQNLGHYRILSLLGKGGMGEVYCAEDTRLRREVAIKVLPDDFANDVGRLRRFEQEARAASALNHPNIITIHEIGEAEGARYIVTEYVAGETLRQRLTRLPSQKMEPEEAVEMTLQIAAALTAAHEAGITHRDIKPENVMVRPDGLVKVLDFGLAKLTERPAAAPEVDPQAETAVRLSTEPGMVMGTVSYMSPEQARGQKVDHRTDIFSLGVMLYEMITGHRPFEGATMSDVIAALLTAEPSPLDQHCAEAPAELERIVSKCLAKDHEDRYQTAEELIAELKSLRTNSRVEGAVTSRKIEATAVSAERPISRSKLRKPGVILSLAALLVVGTAVAYWLSQRMGQQQPAASSHTMKITRLTQTGKVMRAAISPDGKYVAYVMEDAGRQSLSLIHMATHSDTQIVAPAEVDYRSITFSPDGNFLYYVRSESRDPAGGPLNNSGTLYKATLLGKDEKKLIKNVSLCITFSPDGHRLAFVRRYPSQSKSALIVANVDGTAERELAARQNKFDFGQGRPAWSPDGKIIACGTTNYSSDAYRSVVGVSLADGTEIPITSHRWEGEIKGVAWLPKGDGFLVIGAERFNGLQQIWRLSYPGDKAHKLTNDLSAYEDLSLTADSGTLVTTQSDRQINIWIAPGGEARRAKQLTSGSGREDGVRSLVWTPDGKIVYRSIAGDGSNIWIMEADGTGNKLLTFNPTFNLDPAVSPDGRHIVWSFGLSRNIWWMGIDGSNPKQLTNDGAKWLPQYSPDGKWLVYAANPASLWKMPVDGGAPVQLTKGQSWRPSISPDGKLIAFNRQDETSGQYKIAIMSFNGGEPIKILDILGGSFRPIVWTPDGRAVAYPATRGGVSNIWAQQLNGGSPRQLTDFRDRLIFDFAWSKDGKQLALSRGLINSDVALIQNFK